MPPSKVRQAWTLLHRGLGYIAVIWAIAQVTSSLPSSLSYRLSSFGPHSFSLFFTFTTLFVCVLSYGLVRNLIRLVQKGSFLYQVHWYEFYSSVSS